jgi:hypothetical protein
MAKLNNLYDEDFVRWTEEQAAALRQAKGSNLPLDWENLAEEIESLGKSDRRELRSQITRILRYLLKLEASPAAEPRAGWRSTIREARSEIEGVLEDSPSLRREAEAMISKQIRAAAELAADDLGQHGEPIEAIRAARRRRIHRGAGSRRLVSGRVRLTSQLGQHLPNNRLPVFAVLDLAAGRHHVACAVDESGAREVGASRIAEQGEGAAGSQHAQPARDPVCHWLLIADISGGHDVPPQIDRVEQILGRHRDHDLVEQGVCGNRGGCEMVDLGREHRAGAGFGGGNGNEAGTGAKIEYRPASDIRGVIENIARERLPAGPGEGPERRRYPGACEAFFGRLPDRCDLGCEE